MFNQYEPTVKVIITYLKLLNVKVNDVTVEETLNNHPEWPGLLCVSDSLKKWHVPNGVGKINVSKIDKLPVPFIAYTNDREAPLAIITEITETTVQVFKKEYSKIITESRETFIKMWSGIYLIAEPNENSGETNYAITKRNLLVKFLMPSVAIISIVIFFVLLLKRIINTNFISDIDKIISIYVQFVILIVGIVVTSLLLWYEIDKNNPILQKVCGGITKGDCNAILTSKQAKVFSWLSWSEVGFFYFTGSLLTLFFADSAIINSMQLLLGINILALPYTIFSVYYQWHVAKQWCLLCLIVQGVLILSAINLVLGGFFFNPLNLSLPFIVKMFLSYLLPTFIWYSLKPYILSLQAAKKTKREYLRIKFNDEIYQWFVNKKG